MHGTLSPRGMALAAPAANSFQQLLFVTDFLLKISAPGGQAWLPKPFSPGDLLKTILTVFNC